MQYQRTMKMESSTKTESAQNKCDYLCRQLDSLKLTLHRQRDDVSTIKDVRCCFLISTTFEVYSTQLTVVNIMLSNNDNFGNV